MKTKAKILIYMLIIIFAFILWFILWFFLQKYKVNIATKTQILTGYIWGDQEREDINKSYSWNIMDKDMISIVTFTGSNLNTWEFLKFLTNKYIEALTNNDIYYQLQILEKIYEIKKDKKILKYLIEKSLELNNFTLAKRYYDNLSTKDIDDWDKYLFVLINNFDRQADIIKFEKLLNNLYSSGYIDTQIFKFYSLLVDISKWDIQLIKNHLSQEKFTKFKYELLVEEFRKSLQIYEYYKDSPKYYLMDLFAYNLFNNKFYWLARFIARKAYFYNENYILTNQLLAYTNFILWNYDEAKKYLLKLTQLDENDVMYKFLLGILAFEQKDWYSSIVFLDNIKENVSEDIQNDIYRYLALSYYYMKDYNRSFEYFKNIFVNKPNEYDWFTFYEYFLYKPYLLRKKEIFKVVDNKVKEILTSCNKELKPSYKYICDFGYAGYLLNKQELDKAIYFLRKLEKQLPYDFVYFILWNYYYNNRNYEKAKYYYLKGLTVITDKRKRNYILFRLKKIINK